jgi:hypothetical protein
MPARRPDSLRQRWTGCGGAPPMAVTVTIINALIQDRPQMPLKMRSID